MFKSGDIITLKGKTLKGKNRVREHGDKWRVIRVANVDDNVVRISACRVGDLFIESLDERDARWINPHNDKDFEIVP